VLCQFNHEAVLFDFLEGKWHGGREGMLLQPLLLGVRFFSDEVGGQLFDEVTCLDFLDFGKFLEAVSERDYFSM
jgi:hypothetical protein